MKTSRTRSCDGKQRHESKALAEATIGALVRKWGARYGSYRAYACGRCGAWHIGHRRKYRGQR